MSRASLFAELKRRNVLRAGVLYAGAVWALSQGISQLTPALGLPDWATRWFLIACVIGFPFWIAFAWFYEITPGGLKRESEIDSADSIAHSTGRRLDKWIIAVLTLAVVLLLTNTFAWHKGVGLSGGAAAGFAHVPQKSIAVLPLVNEGANSTSAYLGDGISEEILNALSRLPDLKVIGRASSFRFRGGAIDASRIGRVLGVRSLLSGTVQRSGDDLRITVELVDTQSGVQLWSRQYDRRFQNLFALEDDISGAVTQALAVKLGAAADQPLVAVATANPHAHDLYLRAVYLSKRTDEASLDRSVALFTQAIAEDPNYATAWAGLVRAYMNIVDAYRAPVDLLPAMRGAAEKAIALDPDLPSGHIALGYVLLDYVRDFPAARRELERAVALDPNSADAHAQLGWYYMQVEHDPAATQAQLQIAEKLDPLNAWYHWSGVWVAIAQGDDRGAFQQVDRVHQLDPDFSYGFDLSMFVDAAFGRWRDCIARSTQPRALAGSQSRYLLGVCYAGAGDTTLARAVLAQLEAASRTRYVDGTYLAAVHAALGDKGRALAALERASHDRSGPLLDVWMLPWFKPLHDDPRFAAFFKERGPPTTTDAKAMQ